MFGTYLRRELFNRRKQTIIIASGMALAIALVIIVNAVSAGVRQAQESVLQSVYGVGTDITVSQPATAQNATGLQGQGGGPRFDFGANSGTDTGTARQVNTSRLQATRGTIAESELAAIRAAGYTDTQLAEISLAIAMTIFTNTFNRINDTAVDFPPVK